MHHWRDLARPQAFDNAKAEFSVGSCFAGFDAQPFLNVVNDLLTAKKSARGGLANREMAFSLRLLTEQMIERNHFVDMDDGSTYIFRGFLLGLRGDQPLFLLDQVQQR